MNNQTNENVRRCVALFILCKNFDDIRSGFLFIITLFTFLVTDALRALSVFQIYN